MALVVMGAENPIGQNIVRLARNDGHMVVPVFHAGSVPPGADQPHMVAETDTAKEVARSINEGDTVVFVLGANAVARNLNLTDRLHATLAGILGRNIRLVVLDSYLPDISGYEADRSQPPKANDYALRQFFWAKDLESFASQNGSGVTILRSGPIYGADASASPFGGPFWRKVLKGGTQVMPWSVEQLRDLSPVEDVSRALYLLATGESGPAGQVEEFHMPGDAAISIHGLVTMGAQSAGSRAHVIQMPRMARRVLAMFSDQWKSSEDLGIVSGTRNPALAQALVQRIGIEPKRHQDAVNDTIEALRKHG